MYSGISKCSSPRYELRIDCMIFKDEFASHKETLSPQIQVLKKTITGWLLPSLL